jgi:hypothetical protein
LRVDLAVVRTDARFEIERLWRDSPSQLYEQSLRLDSASSEVLRDLLDQRRELDDLRDRMHGAPPEIWLDEWYRALRRFGRKGRSWAGAAPFPWASTGSRELQLGEMAPHIFARLVNEEAGRQLPSVPTVESLSYENPLELVLAVAGAITTRRRI